MVRQLQLRGAAAVSGLSAHLAYWSRRDKETVPGGTYCGRQMGRMKSIGNAFKVNKDNVDKDAIAATYIIVTDTFTARIDGRNREA